MKAVVAVNRGQLQGAVDGIPQILIRAGANAVFAAEKFFKATLNSPHTRRAYGRSVKRFLAWCEQQLLEFRQITPGLAGDYVSRLEGVAATKNQALAALRRLPRGSWLDLLLEHRVLVTFVLRDPSCR
jgi:Phage integrase, N-terminal SAM-like domain